MAGGQFREKVKRFLLLLRRIPASLRAQALTFRRGRGSGKYKLYYRYMSILVLLQALAALAIGLAMTWPSYDNDFFDFKATSSSAVSNEACYVDSHSIFAFWKGFRNYSILAQFIFAQSVIYFATFVMMLLLSFGYSHFQNLPRDKYNSATFKTRMLGWFCKTFPSVLRSAYVLTFLLIFIPFYLIVLKSTCEPRVAGLTSQIRIHNCRAWVFSCVKDKRLFGRQLDCSLRENYSAFPSRQCTSDEKCNFPLPITQDSATPGVRRTIAVSGGICGGEEVSAGDLGHVPICPMCREARTDSGSRVYVEDYEKRFGKPKVSIGGGAASLLEVDSSEVSFAELQHFVDCPHCESHAAFDRSFAWAAEVHAPLSEDSVPISFITLQTGQGDDEGDDLAADAKEAEATEMPANETATASTGDVKPHSFEASTSGAAEAPTAAPAVVAAPRRRAPPPRRLSASPKAADEQQGAKATDAFPKLWEEMSKEAAFEIAYTNTMALIHHGSFAGRVLYLWLLVSAIVFVLVRVAAWKFAKIIPEDVCFYNPPRGGKVLQIFHKGVQLIGP